MNNEIKPIEILERTVKAKLNIERASAEIGAAIGNTNSKISVARREAAIVHLTNAIELLNVEMDSMKVINLRKLLRFDLIRSLKALSNAQITVLMASREWMVYCDQLDPNTAFTKRTAAECLLAWVKGIELLEPYIGKDGVEAQKRKLDNLTGNNKKPVVGSRIPEEKKTVKTWMKKVAVKIEDVSGTLAISHDGMDEQQVIEILMDYYYETKRSI